MRKRELLYIFRTLKELIINCKVNLTQQLFTTMFNWFKKKNQESTPITQNVPEQKQVDSSEKDLTVERMINLKICEEHGYSPASSLPHIRPVELRPTAEIAGRLHAIKAIVLWLMVPADNLEDDKILNFVKFNNLESFLTEDERSILKANRTDEELRNAIGWKFENTWPLAWYFGYESPEISGIMMTGEQMQDILANFTCSINENVIEWASKQKTEAEDQIVMYEDLFYCIHNAVRSAQLGKNTVPEGFHPAGNGGVIHERRHSLTWMISNGVSWKETDLST